MALDIISVFILQGFKPGGMGVSFHPICKILVVKGGENIVCSRQRRCRPETHSILAGVSIRVVGRVFFTFVTAVYVIRMTFLRTWN